MNPALTLGLVSASTALTAVSITCEVALFTSFAESELDQALATVTGAGLVASQFLLVGVFQEHLRNARNALATGVFLLITVLLTISVAGTAAWLETRFQQKHQVSLKSTQEHQLVSSLLKDFETQANSLRKQAVLDRNTGNHWRAGERLKEAAQADEKRLEALAMLKNISSVPQSSGQALAFDNNALRWGLWVVLAALVDLCPLLGFASLRNPNTLSVTTPKAPVLSTETTLSQEKTCEIQPEAAIPTLKSAINENDHSAMVVPINKPIQQALASDLAIPICCHNIQEHQQLLRTEIQSNLYPEGPTIRAIMKRHHVGFHKAKKILNGCKDAKAKLVA